MEQNSLESFARSVVDSVVDPLAFNELCSLHATDMSGLLNILADHIAQGYWAGAWSFADADEAMNTLWGHLISQKLPKIPKYFYSVYEAFDSGEYLHSGDTSDISPEDRYTKPIIEKILQGGRYD